MQLRRKEEEIENKRIKCNRLELETIQQNGEIHQEMTKRRKKVSIAYCNLSETIFDNKYISLNRKVQVYKIIIIIIIIIIINLYLFYGEET